MHKHITHRTLVNVALGLVFVAMLGRPHPAITTHPVCYGNPTLNYASSNNYASTCMGVTTKTYGVPYSWLSTLKSGSGRVSDTSAESEISDTTVIVYKDKLFFDLLIIMIIAIPSFIIVNKLETKNRENNRH